MSLLWIQGAWHDAQPGAEEWAEHGFGHETREQRRDRYIQRVQDAHGVDRDTALHALQHVSRHLREAPQGSAVNYGFASVPGHGRSVSVPEDVFNSTVWERAPVRDIPLTHPVHAGQWFITHRNVAHNLFHPGKRSSSWGDEEETGHPDIEPEPWDEDDAEMSDWEAHGPTDLPRVIRQTDGSHMVADGHHRIATDMLLHKATTKARVVDIRELGGRWQHSNGTVG